MRLAYVDTSALVAIVFAEPGHEVVARELESYDRLFSTNLLEAELRSALAREASADDPAPLLSSFTWIFPDRRLTVEFEETLQHGTLRGADLWHLACALYLRNALGGSALDDLTFSTLDARQKEVAEALGMR